MKVRGMNPRKTEDFPRGKIFQHNYGRLEGSGPGSLGTSHMTSMHVSDLTGVDKSLS